MIIYRWRVILLMTITTNVFSISLLYMYSDFTMLVSRPTCNDSKFLALRPSDVIAMNDVILYVKSDVVLKVCECKINSNMIVHNYIKDPESLVRIITYMGFKNETIDIYYKQVNAGWLSFASNTLPSGFE